MLVGFVLSVGGSVSAVLVKINIKKNDRSSCQYATRMPVTSKYRRFTLLFN